MTSSVQNTIRQATAHVYFQWAVDPHTALMQHRYLFDKDPEPITREMVAEQLGEDAATAWQLAVDARRDFWAAVEKGYQP